MDADERALRILNEISRAPRETGPVTLSPDYLDAIAQVESLPENQSGADKTVREATQAEFLNHYRRVARPDRDR
jgi:hypothetical protein